MTKRAMAGLVLALGLITSGASAQEYLTVEPMQPEEDPALTVVEVTADIGVIGRTTTGIGEPLTDYGYDREPGLGTGLELRLLFGDNRYLRTGIALHGVYQSGAYFGAGGRAFRMGLAEASFAARTLLPCMSNQERQFYASAWLGVSAGRMAAGTGRGEMGPDANERRIAAVALDHSVAGFVLGASIDVHFSAFTLGLRADLRQLYGVDTVAERTMAPSAMLRLGFKFDRAAGY
ncbi:MAG: hypothetical protein JJ863_32310 [Deltaproteobacteria bacterium]|nr:hypothetical protein [Deltaproteobacteria bacterium]